MPVPRSTTTPNVSRRLGSTNTSAASISSRTARRSSAPSHTTCSAIPKARAYSRNLSRSGPSPPMRSSTAWSPPKRSANAARRSTCPFFSWRNATLRKRKGPGCAPRRVRPLGTQSPRRWGPTPRDRPPRRSRVPSTAPSWGLTTKRASARVSAALASSSWNAGIGRRWYTVLCSVMTSGTPLALFSSAPMMPAMNVACACRTSGWPCSAT